MESSKKSQAVDALSSPSNPAHWFAYAVSGYLFLLSMPLLLFPRLLLIISTPREAAGQAQSGDAQDPISTIGPTLTHLERYSCYTNAISMLTVATMILVLTGAIPMSTAPMPDSASNGKSPFKMPTIFIITLFLATNAFTAWTQAGQSTSGGKAIDPADLGIGTYGKVIAICHALFAFWGFGVFMFGNDLTRNAKKGGDSSAKDKSVSGFPFKNQYATEEKQKKKEL